ncbi:MAG: autotransporter-associated beta strand repeat-containing protein [Planctomycetes bacterium]|nr:autotransporter-associated beta strand repeat-containing protein [Planctomycetota bacterium]
MIAIPVAASAQSTVYWDIDGATPGAGGVTPSGTWSSTAANWSPSAAGDAATAAWVSGTGAGDGSVAYFSAGSDATGSFTVTIDGTNFGSGLVVNQGTVNLAGGGFIALGGGTATVRPGTTLGLNSLSRVTQSAGGLLVLDGGTLLMSNTGNAGSLWTSAGAGIQISPNGGTVTYNVGNNVTIFQGTFLGEGGTKTNGGAQTLTKTGTSELRVQGVQTAGYTIAKLKILGGLYRIGSSTNASGQLSAETGFGAIPFGETADAITLDGGAIGTSFAMTLDPFRGITLGGSGGVLNTTSATLAVPGPISGAGPLRLIGRGVTLTGVNSYAGGTIIGSDLAMVGSITTTSGGTATIDSDLRLGAVPATVDATNVQLGTATAPGYLTVTASTLFPATRGFRVGGGGGTLAINTAATVTLAGPLSGTGAFIKTSSGTLVLAGSNSISGGITSWGGGLLEVAADAALGAVSGTLQPAALTLAGATTSGRVRAAESFTMSPNRGITINVGGTTASPLGGTIDVVAEKTLTVPGPITGGGRLTKSGSGTLVLSGSSNYAGTTTVSSGTLVVSGQVTGTAGASVLAGATLVLASDSALATRPLTVGSFGTAAVSGNTATTVAGLSISGSSGLVDVGRGMVTVTAGLSAPSMLASIVSGLGDGTWNGTSGITSSAAAASGGDRTVGWLDNGGGSVTFAFAAAGDTNLDWQVDIIDAANFLAGGKFDSGSPASWNEGDFTYDGFVDILDAASFLSNGLFDAGPYNSAPAAPLGVAAVPEPSIWSLLAAAGFAAGWGVRRRRA